MRNELLTAALVILLRFTPYITFFVITSQHIQGTTLLVLTLLFVLQGDWYRIVHAIGLGFKGWLIRREF